MIPIKIPAIWQREIDAGTEFGLRAAKSLAAVKPQPKKVLKKDTNVSTIGDQIRTEWESKLGYKIVCGTCLAFLSTLNKKIAYEHSSLVEELLLHLPFSPELRSQAPKVKQRRAMLEELVTKLVPSLDYRVTAQINHKVSKPTDQDWVTVVTTAPRQESTLARCLDSIKTAGWKPIVFSEPNCDIIDGYKYFHNEVRLGAWFNWLKSVKWALEKTTANYILSVQDDSLFHPDSRELVEQLMWPTNKTGFISLYTAKHYSENRSGDLKPVGLNRIETSSLWGACALVFSRNSLISVLNHPLVPTWTGVPPSTLSDKEKIKLLVEKKNNPHIIQNVDTAIGKIINGLDLEMYMVDPSPVQHISTYSSIGHSNTNSGKRNCIRCADHSKPLINQVFPL